MAVSQCPAGMARPMLALALGCCALAAANGAFVHPGILVTRPMLDQIRADVAAKKEPAYTGAPSFVLPSENIFRIAVALAAAAASG